MIVSMLDQPREIVLEIFVRADLKTLIILTKVSKRIRELVFDPFVQLVRVFFVETNRPPSSYLF